MCMCEVPQFAVVPFNEPDFCCYFFFPFEVVAVLMSGTSYYILFSFILLGFCAAPNTFTVAALPNVIHIQTTREKSVVVSTELHTQSFS